jgi:hypothetical protein
MAALLAASATTVTAQSLNYLPADAQNATGTYTDLGTTGTAIATTETDNANSAAQAIGFTFNYNGQAFTQFVLNTNGYIKLGATPPSSAALISPFLDDRNPADINIIAASSNIDLTGATDQAAAPTEFRVATTGAAGARVCTIQFKNLRDKNSSAARLAQFATMQFQIKLFEGSNNIELQYGTWTASANPAGTANASSQPFLIGLKGASSNPSNILLAAKAPTQPWSTTEFFADGLFGHFVSNAFLPDAGRTYRFRPATVRNDASVVVYTLGKLPATAASPHSVVAAVTNNGFPDKINVPVTLTVTGANTFTNTKTIPTIAPGQTVFVTFDPYPATLALGTNNVRASISADEVATNNTDTYTQLVTGFAISYINQGAPLNQVGLGGVSAGFFLANKYTVTQPTTVSEISAIVAPAAGNNTSFRLQLYDATGTAGSPGQVLFTSPNLSRTPEGGEVSAVVPDIPVSGSFFVALEITGTNPLLGFQFEDPIRELTYYLKSPGAAWGAFTSNNPFRLALDAKFTGACLPVRDVAVSNITANSADVTFTATPGSGTYVIEYGPRGFTPGTGTRVTSPTSPVNLTRLEPGGNYDVYVRKNCGTELAPNTPAVAFATPCTAAPITTLPYTQTFDFAANGAVPCGFTVLDANNDAATWLVATGGTVNDPQYVRSGSKSLVYLYNANNLSIGGNDWVFTPALTLAAAQQYVVSFYNRVGVLPNTTQAVPEGLEIRVGTAPNPGAMTTTIFENRNLNNTTFTLRTTDPIRVPTNGQYYIGFHVVSNPGAFILALDDITISSGQTTAVNQALSQAIDVYPNPTTGLVSVNLSGTNARIMSATVVNIVGQTVHSQQLTGKQAQLDLRNLAAGVYILKLDLDGQTAVKRISIQK